VVLTATPWATLGEVLCFTAPRPSQAFVQHRGGVQPQQSTQDRSGRGVQVGVNPDGIPNGLPLLGGRRRGTDKLVSFIHASTAMASGEGCFGHGRLAIAHSLCQLLPTVTADVFPFGEALPSVSREGSSGARGPVYQVGATVPHPTKTQILDISRLVGWGPKACGPRVPPLPSDLSLRPGLLGNCLACLAVGPDPRLPQVEPLTRLVHSSLSNESWIWVCRVSSRYRTVTPGLALMLPCRGGSPLACGGGRTNTVLLNLGSFLAMPVWGPVVGGAVPTRYTFGPAQDTQIIRH
jgi:hypothetical protein